MGALGTTLIWLHRQANNLTILRTDILKIFRPRPGPGNIVGQACPNCLQFWADTFTCGKLQFTSTKFPIIPLTNQRTEQLPGCPTPETSRRCDAFCTASSSTKMPQDTTRVTGCEELEKMYGRIIVLYSYKQLQELIK